MRPVRQTITTVPGGNCFAACVAAILEIPIDHVPNFCADGTEDWMAKGNEWFGRRGLCMFDFEGSRPGGPLADCNGLVDGMYLIASGKSPRGDWKHSVVARYCLGDGAHCLALVHDPHPDGTFLDGAVESITMFLATRPERVAIPFDPAAERKEQ